MERRAIARRRLRHRYGSRGTFFCARVGDAAHIDGTFDIVVAKSLLHHLDDDDARRLVEMARRVLRPGGVLITSDNVYYDGQPWISRTLARLDRGGRVRTPEA